MNGRQRRHWRGLALMAAVTLTTAGTLVATGGSAGAQKLQESTRYESVEQPITNWTTYASNGTPTGKDPNCPTFPGVRRSSKVWADAYGIDEALHADFRMQFHSTYSDGVAAAQLAFQNAGVTPSCATLNAFQNLDAPTAREWVSCAVYTQNRPTRWCQLALNYPNDPTRTADFGDRCVGGPANGAPGWPEMWHEWHNLSSKVGEAAHLYNMDAIQQIASWLSSLGLKLNVPVYLDDVTIVGGVSNFDQSSAEPTYGNAWYGYGQVMTPATAEALADWYDAAASKLGYDPIATPVKAHNAVDAAIAAGNQPTGTNGWTRAQLYSNVMCTQSPKVQDVVDPGGSRTLAGIGEDLSNWVQAETGKTLCQNVQGIKKFASVAGPACNNTFVGLLFAVIDNNTCMNQPQNGIADLLKVNLGCTRDLHLAKMFSQVKAFLGA